LRQEDFEGILGFILVIFKGGRRVLLMRGVGWGREGGGVERLKLSFGDIRILNVSLLDEGILKVGLLDKRGVGRRIVVVAVVVDVLIVIQ